MKICTHGGQFHADDVLAMAILTTIDRDAEVVRSRDPEAWAAADVVVDVGGKLDVEGEHGPIWLDHHQPGGAGSRLEGGHVPYAAAGLTWREYGEDYLLTIGVPAAAHGYVKRRVDEQLVAGLDAADNGVELVERYKGAERPMGVSAVIAGMNPTWDDSRTPDQMFGRAVEFMRCLVRQVADNAAATWRARGIVAAAYDVREDPAVLVLPQAAPWKETLLQELGDLETKFVVFPDHGDANAPYKVQQVPVELGSFSGRAYLPVNWAGLRDDALRAASGIADAVFCHRGRFFGGAKSLAGALAMARVALVAVAPITVTESAIVD